MKVPSKITIPIWIKNGQFSSNLPIVKNILEAHNGSLLQITFHKKRNKRSNNQNAYYWTVIVSIFQNCIKEEWQEIWSTTKVHELLKTNCNYEELINEETGQVVRRTKSTTENTTTDQENFHTNCRTLALDYFSTEIPMPNEKIELKF